MVTFGEILRYERKRKGISLDKMANDLNTTKTTLCRYEHNAREPKLDIIKSLADYFDCSTDYLLGRTEHREGFIVKSKAGNDNIKLEVNNLLYPDGLTHEQVLKLLECLKNAGLKWSGEK